MESANVDILREFLLKGRAKDLLDMLKGESKYNIEIDEDLSLDKETRKVWRMAISHVEFVSKFGLIKQKAEERGHFYSAYPRDFDNWLSLGAPGITQEEIESYLKENPL
ncbi:hypothetical protein A3194_12520 [Candidatus Thiodiazotropha endoloripes]|uniref:hypothetical protein n=1 Tax=Candidatus Thiodiazotropha endoloripes TaxID=1818881 RepID=UPI00083E2811|nr:hypothetical protein [Candidatus Thiodiazotropha endoloripes]ODB85651.1 hypothetical protein A3194_12520 [Candidatus Thiodiazotropha endoloripes]